MSWLFLGVSVWGALFTLNALYPTWSGPRRAALSFAAGWLTSELALHHLGWQAVATVLFGLAGAFDHWPGQLGLAITASSWAGLVAAHLVATRSGEVTEQALVRVLGADYRDHILPEQRAQLSDSVDWKRVVRPFPIRLRQVERIQDISFARVAGLDLKLDVYRHRDRPTNCPVLFQIHGGAWVIGSKDEQALPLMQQLAARGWVCVSANYRLSPHATWPEHLIDCKQALVWLKRHAVEYGANADFVVATGGSAGGHLAAMVALTANDPEFQPGFEGSDTSVQGCVPFYGVYDFSDRYHTERHSGRRRLLERQIMKGSHQEKPEAWDRASPIARVHGGAPAFFVIHGMSDTLVPVAEARAFVRSLGEKTREPLVYAELPGAQHAFELFPSVRSLQVNASVERFLAYLYSRFLVERHQYEERAS